MEPPQQVPVPENGGVLDFEMENQEPDVVEAPREEGRERRTSGSGYISNFWTLIHLLKSNIGPGILAMPYAIKNSGVLVGSAALVFMASICIFCMHSLVVNARRLCDKKEKAKSLNYAEVAHMSFALHSDSRYRSFAPTAKFIINLFLCVTQVGFCCVYFVFVADHLQQVLDQYSYLQYLGAILLGLLILVPFGDLKRLSPISMIATVSLAVGVVALLILLFLEDKPPGFKKVYNADSGSGAGLPDTWERKLSAGWNWDQYALFFGTAIYAFEGIGTVLPLENKMKTPEDMKGWNGVLVSTMEGVAILYIFVGFMGYWKYGEVVAASITLNLPVGDRLASAVKILFAFSVLLTYPLQLYVPVEIILSYLCGWTAIKDRKHTVENLLRWALVFLTYGIAATVPRLDLVIPLVGSLASSLLALIAPAVINLVTEDEKICSTRSYTRSRLWGLIDRFLIVVGVFGFIFGSYASSYKLIFGE